MRASFRQWLGSVVFTCSLFTSVAVYGVVVLLSAPFGRHVTYRLVTYWARGVLAALATLCGLRHEVEGMENLPAGGAVVLMKHSSSWETIAQLALLPPQTWVMKRELLWAPMLGWCLMLLKPIAIDRRAGRSAVQQVISQGCRRLDEGLFVVIFPEGTRVPAGEVKRYGLSGALLATAAGRPIVPIAHNAGEFWPRRGWLKRPGTIRMVVGSAIDSADRDARELTETVRMWIQGELARIGTQTGKDSNVEV